ncbi:hypothetical protein ACLB2K_049968 [Fragaria x ananassa]
MTKWLAQWFRSSCRGSTTFPISTTRRRRWWCDVFGAAKGKDWRHGPGLTYYESYCSGLSLPMVIGLIITGLGLGLWLGFGFWPLMSYSVINALISTPHYFTAADGDNDDNAN